MRSSKDYKDSYNTLVDAVVQYFRWMDYPVGWGVASTKKEKKQTLLKLLKEKPIVRDENDILTELEDEINLDPDGLDVNSLEQVELVEKWGQRLSTAKKATRAAHEKLKTIRSEIILKAKGGDVEKLGSKPTDSTVEAYYRTRKSYKSAKRKWLQRQFEEDMLFGRISTLGHRRSSLEFPGRLMSMEYFAPPSSPRNLAEETEKKKQTRKKIRKRMNRKE